MNPVDYYTGTPHYVLTHGQSKDKINLEQYIVACELLLEDIHSINSQNDMQLEFLKYLNHSGCKTFKDVITNISNGLIDPSMMRYFFENNYLGRDSTIMDCVRSGYPEFFVGDKPETHLN